MARLAPCLDRYCSRDSGAAEIHLEDTDDRLELGTQRLGAAIEWAGEGSKCFEEQCEEMIGIEDDHCQEMPQERYVNHPE